MTREEKIEEIMQISDKIAELWETKGKEAVIEYINSN